jgi:hypothetical protein
VLTVASGRSRAQSIQPVMRAGADYSGNVVDGDACPCAKLDLADPKAKRDVSLRIWESGPRDP